VQLDIISELSLQIFNGFRKENKIWDYRKQLKYPLLKLVESVGIL